MSDERQPISRREFAAMTLAAGVSAATGASAAAAELAGRGVVEKDVLVKMPDGLCDAVFVQPRGTGSWPAVIIFPDIFGVRPGMRTMAKRLAGDGYSVLVPNPYYRLTKAPGIALDFKFDSPADREKLSALRAPLTQDAVMRDSTAYVAFLDAQPGVHIKAAIGVVGYCMGGPMTLQAAAANPARIGAGASFHGGGLVTDKPDSPHLLIAKIKAQYYFGIATNDDDKQPDAKTQLQQAFQAAHVAAKIEVYPGTLHGWCVPDMPAMEGKPIYNHAEAERAWGELLALYRRTTA